MFTVSCFLTVVWVSLCCSQVSMQLWLQQWWHITHLVNWATQLSVVGSWLEIHDSIKIIPTGNHIPGTVQNMLTAGMENVVSKIVPRGNQIPGTVQKMLTAGIIIHMQPCVRRNCNLLDKCCKIISNQSCIETSVMSTMCCLQNYVCSSKTHYDTGHWDTRTLGHIDTGIPGQWGTRTLGHLDTGILGHRDAWTLGRQDTGAPGHWDTRTMGHLGHWDTWSLGHLDTGTPGHWDIWTLGHLDTGTPGHWDTWTLGH